MTRRFAGSIVAIVTPWRNGVVDYVAWQRIVEWQIENGTQGIVPCGTTGESATFTHNEQYEAIARMVDTVAGRVPVVAGAGSNCTREAVLLAEGAERAGADGVLSVTPYYNKPTPNGLFEHYRAVREAITLPIVLYNVPGRTGVSMDVDTISRVHELGGIDSIKDATGDLGQCQETLSRGIRVLSGEDGLVLPMMALGAEGVISVVANFAPRLMRDLCDAVAEQRLADAQTLHRTVHQYAKAAFAVTNPIPAKAVLASRGFCLEEYRLPLTPLTPDQRSRLLEAVESGGLERYT